MSRVPLAVVTGATGGIGRATCQVLGEAGYAILAQYRSDAQAALELQAQLSENGVDCHLVPADLSTAEGVDAVAVMTTMLLEAHHELELRTLVNNAAVLLGPSFDGATFDSFDRYFALNTRAPFFLSQSLVPQFADGGSIVNLSSASAHFSSPGDIVYAMSKAAVESFTKNLAEAVAPRGIRVNAVIPGFTDNGHDAFRNPDVLEYMSGFSVLGGVSDPLTVAHAIAFLASDQASRTTGAVLDVTGGSLLGARGKRQHSVKDLIR